MNYKLAKQLKEAGFEQIGEGKLVPDPTKKANYYAPTLEELIKACGEGYFIMEHLQDSWVVRKGLGVDWWIGAEALIEAVAGLWLKLNDSKS